jgi:transcriptional regulator with XRE-family HTH domain
MKGFQQERLILEVTELIERLMKEQGVSKLQFAERLGKTKGYITQLLDGQTNMTLRTISDVMFALGRSLGVGDRPLSVSSMPVALTTEDSHSELEPSASVNGLSGEVLTLAEAAAYLRLPEAEVVGLVHSQALPGRPVAGEWRFLKAAIQHWLAAASPTWETTKAAILELAGKYKDDPELEQIVAEAYRRRGRPISEGASSKGLGD